MVRLALALVVVAGLLGTGLWLAPRLVPEPALERWFTARVEAALGAELRVAGVSRLELLPRPALELGPWRTTTPMGPLRGEGARVVFDWRRLLVGEAAVAAAEVSAPTLVAVAPPPPAALAADLAGLALGPIRLGLTGGRVVVPDGDDVLVAALTSGPAAGGRRVEATLGWRERKVELVAEFARPGAGEPATLRRLRLESGGDRLRFAGRLDAAGRGAGTVELAVAAPAALRAWLLGSRLPAPLDQLLAHAGGPLEVTGELSLAEAGWTLDDAAVALGATRAEGRIAVTDGGLDADLELEAAPAAGEWLAAADWPARYPEILDDVARIALDGDDVRLRLERVEGGLAASLRLGLAGASELSAEGRLDEDGPRFEGPVTLVSDDVGAALPPDLARFLPTPAALTLAADLTLTPDRAALAEVRLSAPALVFRGAVAFAREQRPAVTVDGVVDRLRLPAAVLRRPAERARLLDRLAALAEVGGAEVDLEVRRLLVNGDGGLEGRLIAELDPAGLWLTAFEASGPAFGLSLTGGLRFGPPSLDALGALRLEAPARLLARLGGAERAALAAVPGGRFDVALDGPLDALAVELDGRLGELDARFEGTARLVDDNAVAGPLRLAHPDAGALLAAWGRPPHPSRPLAGAAGFDGRVELAERWRAEGAFDLAGLAGELVAAPGVFTVAGLGGPVADLHAALTALTPWPADLARWRARVQGDWPATPPLASLWPAPVTLELDAPALVTAEGGAAALALRLVHQARRTRLERFSWRDDARRYDLAGTAERGRRGIALAGRGEVRDAATAPLPTALGLGWLGDGALELEGALRAQGTDPAELAAALAGEVAVAGAVGPSLRRAVDGRVLALPRLRLDGTLAVERGGAALGDLLTGAADLDGRLDLLADRLAARLRLSDEPRPILVTGPLDQPRWRRLEPAAAP